MTNCCPIRRKLGDDFAISARLYSEAVVAFTSNPTLISRSEFDRLCLAKEEALRRSETARVAFNEHVDSHRCLPGDNLSPYTDSDATGHSDSRRLPDGSGEALVTRHASVGPRRS